MASINLIPRYYLYYTYIIPETIYAYSTLLLLIILLIILLILLYFTYKIIYSINNKYGTKEDVLSDVLVPCAEPMHIQFPRPL